MLFYDLISECKACKYLQPDERLLPHVEHVFLDDANG